MVLTLMFRIIIFYLFILIAYRMINKQELKELTIADGIIFILTAQLLIEVLFYNNTNISIVILPVLVLIFLRPLVKMFNLKKEKDNTLVIKNGLINFNVFSKTKYTIYKLLEELEKKGINKIEDVKSAYLDDDKLIIDVFQKPLSLIFNGDIDYQALIDINKHPDWLMEILKSKNLNLDNVYYSFYVDDRLYIIQKDL